MASRWGLGDGLPVGDDGRGSRRRGRLSRALSTEAVEPCEDGGVFGDGHDAVAAGDGLNSEGAAGTGVVLVEGVDG